MKNYYNKINGYQETIQKGLIAARTFRRELSMGKESKNDNIQLLKEEL